MKMAQGRKMLGALGAAALVGGSLSVPALAADDGGTVSATVPVAAEPEVCITIDRTSITYQQYTTFGPLEFGAGGFAESLRVANCSTVAFDLYVSATKPTSAQGSQWQLSGTGTVGVNLVRINAYDLTSNFGGGNIDLTETFTKWNTTGSIPPEQWADVGNNIEMPTSGDGAGEMMTFDIFYLATAAD